VEWKDLALSRHPAVKVSQSSRLIGGGSFVAGETDGLQLAVLSACNTEGETQIGNPGTEGLAKALLRARVPHVIASRWKIDSTETAVFMRKVYAGLLAGNNVSNSIRIAELSLASQAGSAHPYFWCAFELQGST
jgi:CHAT domain-containing protein